MPRTKRIQTPGLIRHVMSRGNGRMTIFLDDTDYRWFVYLLSVVAEAAEIEIWNYCLMPNHTHLTLRPRRPTLSEAMRRLNGAYAQWWNRRHHHVGHVFQDRFKDQIVQREGYLEALCRYVAQNPVRAGLVSHPADWEWSSYRATVGISPVPAFLSVSSVLRHFGGGSTCSGASRFAEYVLGNEPGECMDERFRSRERVLGGAEFRKVINGDIVLSPLSGD